MILLLLLACSGPDTDDPKVGSPPTSSGDSGPIDTDTSSTIPTSVPLEVSRAALQDDGFAVGDGALVFSTMEGCCDPGANCWGNNPTTPYGAYAVPPPPGEPPRPDTLLEDFGPVPDGLSRDFLMEPHEAFVWLGSMPPQAKYFGFRSLIAKRPSHDHFAIGSLGAATNQLTVGAPRDESVWGQPIALITTADATIEQRVRDALITAGWDPAYIATDRIAPVVNLGLDPEEHDSLFTTMRSAVYDDPAAGAAWEQDPGVVWRLTLDDPPEPNPHPMPELPGRDSGEDESAWADAHDQLEQAVLDAFSPVGTVTEANIQPYWRETLECIESDFSCAGDIRDRFVGISPYFRLFRPKDVIVVYGVNHERTGRASYSSVSIQTIDNQRGVASVTSTEMVGSARTYLDHPLVDDLYVVLFARDCSLYPGTVCVDVPWDCPGGPSWELFKITGRAYLDPATGAAPAEEELLRDRALMVVPGSFAGSSSTGDTGSSTGP